MIVDIPGILGYRISDRGEVYSDKSNKFLSLWINNRGRVLVTFSINGSNKHYLVSRLVAFSFGLMDSLENDLEVDHKDTNPLNNSLKNLQVLTPEKHLLKTLKDRGFKKRNKEKFKSFELKNSSITVEDIEYWVIKFSWVRAAKELGLSDNGLRKRYKLLSGKDPKNIKNKC